MFGSRRRKLQGQVRIARIAIEEEKALSATLPRSVWVADLNGPMYRPMTQEVVPGPILFKSYRTPSPTSTMPKYNWRFMELGVW